ESARPTCRLPDRYRPESRRSCLGSCRTGWRPRYFGGSLGFPFVPYRVSRPLRSPRVTKSKSLSQIKSENMRLSFSAVNISHLTSTDNGDCSTAGRVTVRLLESSAWLTAKPSKLILTQGTLPVC